MKKEGVISLGNNKFTSIGLIPDVKEEKAYIPGVDDNRSNESGSM